MKKDTGNNNGPTLVVPYERALEEGTRGWNIRRAAVWHKEAAEIAQGRAKERHFKIAADLNRLAAKLEETGHP